MTQVGHDLHTDALAEVVSTESLKRVGGDIIKLRKWLAQMDDALGRRRDLQPFEVVWAQEMMKICLKINNNIERANGVLLMRFKKLTR